MSEIIDPARKLAIKLCNILTRYRALMRRVFIAKWTRDFREGLRFRSYEEFDALLDWLSIEDNFRWQYTPRIRSAATFIDRYEDIVDARRRKRQQCRRNGEYRGGYVTTEDLGNGRIRRKIHNDKEDEEDRSSGYIITKDLGNGRKRVTIRY